MQSVSFYMADGNLTLAVITKTAAARFDPVWRRVIDKFVQFVKTAREIETAMPVGDKNTRPDGVFLRSYDAYRSFRVPSLNFLAGLKNPVRNERFLAHNPQHPVQRNGAVIIGSENENFVFAAIRLLDYIKHQILAAVIRRVME